MQQPKYMPPFAENGDKEDVPNTADQDTVSLEYGFTPIYSKSVTQNGKLIPRTQFNGVINEYSQHTAFQNLGGQYTFDTAIGIYDKGVVLWSEANNCFVISNKENNTDNFVLDNSFIGTSWIKINAGNADYATQSTASTTAEAANKLIGYSSGSSIGANWNGSSIDFIVDVTPNLPVTRALYAGGLGVNQNWSLLYKTTNVIYTNTSLYPICLLFYIGMSNVAYVKVNGTSLINNFGNSLVATCVIVPPTQTYEFIPVDPTQVSNHEIYTLS